MKVDGAVQAELKRLLSKVPAPLKGLTDKNKRFLRQFDDPEQPATLSAIARTAMGGSETREEPDLPHPGKGPSGSCHRILIYMPIRLQNLLTLEFERHLFIRTGRGAKSTLELSNGEVKNDIDLAFEIPPQVVKMLVEYRDRIAAENHWRTSGETIRQCRRHSEGQRKLLEC